MSVPELLVDNGSTFVPGTAVHNMTLYRASNGALVFGAGTVQGSWGLDPDHDTNPDMGPSTPDPVMEQATASGLQQVLFSSPVAIQANTTYVASYFTSVGNYAADGGMLATAVDNAPVHALSSSAAGGNGVYLYSASSAFANQTFNSTNYWVDVVFKLTLP